MNPYDFVRINWLQPPARHSAQMFDRFHGLAGHLSATVTALTPIFIPGQQGLSPIPFLKDGRGRSVIPGSSLKGLFRSLVETVAPGCWWLYDGSYKNPDGGFDNYEDKLPQEFRHCSRLDRLCVACRLFGMMLKREHLTGKVGFDDAVCVEEKRHASVYTPILEIPKPRHRVWYISGDNVAGRKYYFHQPSIRTERGIKTAGQVGKQLNRYITPLDAGSRFEFTANFHNVDEFSEWPVLLYALALEEGLRHKIGYAKPAGFGSVSIELQEITLKDMSSRYRAGGGRATTYTGDDLKTYVREKTASFVGNQGSVTLQDLRRVWAWPPAQGVDYKYPDRLWFNENHRTPIRET